MIFYIFILIFAFLSLFYSIKSLVLINKINKYNEILNLSLPETKEKKNDILLSIKFKLLDFFSASYDNGFKSRGILILLICAIIFLILNSIFLKFNVFLVFLLALIIGAKIGKKIEFRQISNEFEKTFPEALVILNGAVSSGSNITKALEDVSKTITGVLSHELKTIVKGLEIGDEPSHVFMQSYKRLPFDNYYFFLTSLLVSLKSGARLKEILSRLSQSINQAKAMQRKKLAMTSEARMSSKITAAIPFAFLFLMKFINPDNFDYILNDPSGRYILYYFLGSEFIGMLMLMFLMRKI